MTNLPFVTYGTLRPGASNYSLLDGHTSAEETVTVDGFRLVSNGGFPYALVSPGDTIVATLNYVADEHYSAVESRLDALEGFYAPGDKHNHYDRVVVEAKTSAGAVVEAWMYIPASPRDPYVANLAAVPGNDWFNVRPARSLFAF